MMTSGNDWVAIVHTKYLAGRPIALLFDYDGTLTPIVSHPALALLSEPVRGHIRQLADKERVSVGVISGRPLNDVSRMVRLDGVYYAGSSGAEVNLCGIRLEWPVSLEVQRQLEAILAELRAALPDFPGVWIEPKPVGFTVHYRGVPTSTASIFGSCFRWIIGRYRGLRSLNICAAFEVTPVEAWDKGTAVRLILAKLPPDVIPVYFGDSENDRPGMLASQAAGGLTIAIGDTAPNCAMYRVESAAAFQTDLSRLCEALITSRDRVLAHSDELAVAK
ncbi:MAG: trehalose-phosphatase [Planctomycetes bacterium]|nr:trehalose-phosphatase [Planctomycetota bacterium]